MKLMNSLGCYLAISISKKKVSEYIEPNILDIFSGNGIISKLIYEVFKHLY